MSREHWNGYGLTPDEMPEPFAPREPSAELKRKPWSQEDVYAYRDSLAKLGFSGDALEDLIERDCGREFSERAMFGVRQAQ